MGQGPRLLGRMAHHLSSLIPTSPSCAVITSVCKTIERWWVCRLNFESEHAISLVVNIENWTSASLALLSSSTKAL